MKIIIDVTPLYHGSAGISNYTSGLISGLAAIDSENEYILYGGRQGLFGANRKIGMIPSPPQPNFRRVISRAPTRFSFLLNLLPIEFFAGGAADVYHGTSFLLPGAVCKSAIKKVVTVHDLSFEVNIGWYPQKIYSEKWRSAVRKSSICADKIIAPSESTKKDIISIYGIDDGKIEVIPEAPMEIFTKLPNDNYIRDMRKIYAIPSNFILTVGRIEKRKNFAVLVDALALLKNTLGANTPKLVVVGNDGYGSEEFYARLKYRGLSDWVAVYKNMPTEFLPVFYKSAKVFVFPSLYEGFGLPILESMACSCPVISSNRASLPEVVGDGGIIVNPDSPEEIASALSSLITDENLRDKYVKKAQERVKKFNWTQAALSTLNVYKKLS